MWVTNYCLSNKRVSTENYYFSPSFGTHRTTTATNDVFVHESKRNNAAVRFSLGSNNDGLT